MELDHYDTSTLPGCSRPVKGCAIAMGIILMIFIGVMMWMVRLPGVQSIVTCQSHMTAIGQALGRYADLNNEYPPSLDDLRKEYIKDPKVFRCPLDIAPGNATSYIYRRPSPNSPDGFVMLECDRHRLKSNMPVSRLTFTKGGKFMLVKPTVSQIIKEEKKQKK